MFAISEVLDSQLTVLVGGLITLVGTVNFFLLRTIKKDTSQVNTAVNHIEPGKKRLTERVDRIEETLHTIQHNMYIAKGAAIEVADRSKANTANLVRTNNMMETLLASHVDTKHKLEQILDFMPKRKSDETESE